MSQPSVAFYYNSRKRPAIDDFKIDSPCKVIKLDQDKTKETEGKVQRKVVSLSKSGKSKGVSGLDISTFLNNVKKDEKNDVAPNQSDKELTPELNQIRKRICASAKFTELKASIDSFKKSAEHLKSVEKRTNELAQSPKLKTFNSIKFEVLLSPQKPQSPEKPYLSPIKASNVRKNLLNVLSPTKTSLSKYDCFTADVADSTIKPCLQLPFKYKTLYEMFRAVDTIAQILFNRKELITFNKLKPAVEEMIKRTFMTKHLAQLKFIYSTAYEYTQEKVKSFGTGLRQTQWELVLTPKISTENMTTQVLLDRRRKFHENLVDKVKIYHNEFLLSLTPPMVIPEDKLTRWHPEFDVERVPEIEFADLPQAPITEKFTSGKEILENARRMFNTNASQAVLNLKEISEKESVPEQRTIIQANSTIKGIPKVLLEKVRQKQAAKALMTMTRTADREKEIQMYSRLPEIARLIRNLFVTEKKGVLELDFVAEKLGNSYRSFVSKIEMEDHLKMISKEVPVWLAFHKLRNSVFLKLDKNADLSLVLNKLENLAKQKSAY